MPLTKRSLALPASPASVKLARAWVSQILTEIDRDDLTFGAQLGVSELVTNALLHAQPPLTIRVRGTREHPRIEVSDHSPAPLTLIELPDDGSDSLTTFGRGLALVAINSAHWGWAKDADGIGKTVWFEPAAEMRDDFDLSAVFDQPDDEPESPVEVPQDSLPIVLLNVPAQLFGRLRRYHFELRRELRLLSLSDPDRYPIARKITDVFRRGDIERRASSGISKLDSAIAQGLSHVDLEYAVPASAPATFAEFLELLGEATDFFADEQLLAVAPTGQLEELQRWYFTEFIRQGAGETPLPWPGDDEIRRDSVS